MTGQIHSPVKMSLPLRQWHKTERPLYLSICWNPLCWSEQCGEAGFVFRYIGALYLHTAARGAWRWAL